MLTSVDYSDIAFLLDPSKHLSNLTGALEQALRTVIRLTSDMAATLPFVQGYEAYTKEVSASFSGCSPPLIYKSHLALADRYIGCRMRSTPGHAGYQLWSARATRRDLREVSRCLHLDEYRS